MKCCERRILQTQMRQIVRRSKTEVLRRVLVFERPVIPGGRGGGGRRAGLQDRKLSVSKANAVPRVLRSRPT